MSRIQCAEACRRSSAQPCPPVIRPVIMAPAYGDDSIYPFNGNARLKSRPKDGCRTFQLGSVLTIDAITTESSYLVKASLIL